MDELIKKWREFSKERLDMYADYPEILMYVKKPAFADFMDWLAQEDTSH